MLLPLHIPSLWNPGQHRGSRSVWLEVMPDGGRWCPFSGRNASVIGKMTHGTNYYGWRRRAPWTSYNERLARHDADRVAVGRRVGARARADIRGPAGAVFDHDRLPPAPGTRMKMSPVPPAPTATIALTGRLG